MTTEIKSLQLAVLRAANLARLPQFKNKRGALAHTVPDGSDWSFSDWLEAVTGELGELANWHKKFRRGDIDIAEWEKNAKKELADIAIYLDIAAARALDLCIFIGQNEHGDALYRHSAHSTGIDLGAAMIAKFNEVSERVGSTVRIEEDAWWYQNDEAQTFPAEKKLDGGIRKDLEHRAAGRDRRVQNDVAIVAERRRLINRREADKGIPDGEGSET